LLNSYSQQGTTDKGHLKELNSTIKENIIGRKRLAEFITVKRNEDLRAGEGVERGRTLELAG